MFRTHSAWSTQSRSQTDNLLRRVDLIERQCCSVNRYFGHFCQGSEQWGFSSYFIWCCKTPSPLPVPFRCSVAVVLSACFLGETLVWSDHMGSQVVDVDRLPEQGVMTSRIGCVCVRFALAVKPSHLARTIPWIDQQCRSPMSEWLDIMGTFDSPMESGKAYILVWWTIISTSRWSSFPCLTQRRRGGLISSRTSGYSRLGAHLELLEGLSAFQYQQVLHDNVILPTGRRPDWAK